MSKQAVFSDKAPKPLPFFSPAIIANGPTVYCSGCTAIDPATNKLIDGDVQAQTHRAIQNLGFVLEAAGSSLEKVVKVNVFLMNMDDFAAVNEVYMQYWGDVKPCRTCVAVAKLPGGADVEIECIALQSRRTSTGKNVESIAML
ncbi:MAG: hypothetical protein M1834_006461 [Cirrosporium novae-zelandiae]|nr:MAG: hypothetical protein M1834_006461 [Cirrosporium novae-zelandiae]